MQINGKEYRTVWFDSGQVLMIDQNKIPHEFALKEYSTYQEVATAIREMTVRGAPAIGAAGAFGMALAALAAPDHKFRAHLRHARQELISTRPTAIDLSIGVQYVYESALKFIPDLPHARQVAVLAAGEFANKSAEDCLELGWIGAELIQPGARILTHCNAGALATVDHGTALSVIRCAHKQGKNIFVYVAETRPRLQGARLTAFELEQEGIPHAIITDSAGGFYFWKKEIDLVITGADRICLNGDIANKIGTYEKAVLAHAHKRPFYVAAPDSTFDLSCAKGEDIPIEIRSETEIKRINGKDIANPGSPALNPAFDITPAKYITGIITPKGVFSPQKAAQRIQS
ncbi:MAG: S-methyl-5-thioribose-1-phosphate isomerase [Candidatus Cloacimonadaceae bacterium]|jgi:S-methyl-5-thioribose-1-phosphate isomerase|nr:S-methyl-5-thioribose-1-phosphate isomerase [Candidatus Cloacimonadota bacterium]MDY0127860.1 S-methyl-5-thioribose-1-phosphate isomerase [Candidatus Cloacimonadaceae bacterium]MCB5255517.1 S-methyl-5-thioribose-1-phosphate isomerase [Candidatus Cloacimonadota bacterium]MCK9179172.1 S-methyl-5-thioribose-1-phosphate isomerase [Candidatus Cloacimonadota bacterium]MCK9242140.1 S-methyl-5-thioribose-1-phosphate isomerase [Candidatus Cloacimonadota bacterium]